MTGISAAVNICYAQLRSTGVENFKREVLHVYDNEADMNTKERELVTAQLIESGQVYNIMLGGDGGFGYINSNGLSGSVKGGITCRHLHPNPFLIASNRCKLEESLLALTKAQTETARKSRILTMQKKGHQQGNKNSQFGSKWATNNIVNLKLTKDKPLPPRV